VIVEERKGIEGIRDIVEHWKERELRASEI
jgi:hypothetical protein